MKILIVTPAPRHSRAGNRTTAVRWDRCLRQLGHRVDVCVRYTDEDPDLLVALHAWRSADSVRAFRDRHPERGLIVALTGTDIYRFIHSDPEPTLRSMEMADALVGLHETVPADVPAQLRDKLHIIFQSAAPLPSPRKPSQRHFDVCVVGHLRDEKDPLRAAEAVRDLPQASRIRVLHFGMAHDESWAERARAEGAINPRYHWLGDQPYWRVRRAYGHSRVLVLSSKMEGGANVVSEAVVADLPVIASGIPGSIGLLGQDYPGYFSVGDTEALRTFLRRAEDDRGFLETLQHHCRNRAPLFTEEQEVSAWAALLRGL